MILEMNGKEYELNFGFDFLDYINEKNALTMTVSGQEMSTGAGGAVMTGMMISSKQPSTLRQLIIGGTINARKQPTDRDIKKYIDELVQDEEEYELVFDSIVEEIKKEPSTSREMALTESQND